MAILQTIYLGVNKIINIRLQYLKLFNCVQASELWLIWNVTHELFVYKW